MRNLLAFAFVISHVSIVVSMQYGIEDKGTLNEPDAKNKLYNAIRTDQLEDVKSLLEGHVDSNQSISGSLTPILVAAQLSGTPEILKILHVKKADINARDYENNTALISFFSRRQLSENDLEFAKYLLKIGADTNSVNKCNYSALNVLLYGNRFGTNCTKKILHAMAELLLQNNADPDIGNIHHWSGNDNMFILMSNVNYARNVLRDEDLAHLLIQYKAQK